MSFNVSISFNLSETIGQYWIIRWFQFGNLTNVKQWLDEPPNTACFNVSDVSYLNRLFENVFGACPRERKITEDGRQDYTKSLSEQPSVWLEMGLAR